MMQVKKVYINCMHAQGRWNEKGGGGAMRNIYVLSTIIFARIVGKLYFMRFHPL